MVFVFVGKYRRPTSRLRTTSRDRPVLYLSTATFVACLVPLGPCLPSNIFFFVGRAPRVCSVCSVLFHDVPTEQYPSTVRRHTAMSAKLTCHLIRIGVCKPCRTHDYNDRDAGGCTDSALHDPSTNARSHGHGNTPVVAAFAFS